MSGFTITGEQRANVSTYLSEVLLHDMLKAKIAELEGGSSALFASVIGAVVGGAVTLGSGGAAAILGGAFLGAILPPLINENLSRFSSPSNPAAARIQADNFYWYLVKRQIFCNLPANTTDINDALVARIAQEIENIVPYDGNDFGSRTSANQFLSSFLRSIPVNELRNVIEVAAQRWIGNRNGLALPEVNPGCLTSNTALIPVIGDTGVIPSSERVGPNTWRIASSSEGIFKWRTAFSNQCYRIDSILAAVPPIPYNPPVEQTVVSLKCEGTETPYSNWQQVVGKEFRELLVWSSAPFELYITLSEVGNPASSSPTAVVQFTTPAQTVVEGASTTVQAKLVFIGPVTPTTTVNVEVAPNSSATLGSDFTVSPTQLTFGPNNTTQNITVNVLNDTLTEPAERVIFTLTNPTGGAVIGRPNQHVLTIENEWVKEFDFTQGKQGWEALPYWLGTNGIYHDTAPNILGWHSTANGRLYLAHPLSNVSSNTRITEVSIEFDRLTGASTGFYNGYGYTSPSDVQQTVMISFSGEMSKSQTTNMTLANGVSYEVYGTSLTVLQKIILKGSGTNPFI